VLKVKYQYKKRFERSLEIIKKNNSDIVALQEVTYSFLKKVLNDKWIRKKYYFHKIKKKRNPPGGLFIFSIYPIVNLKYHHIPSKAGRRILIAKININGSLLTVANVHLESKPKAKKYRAKQLKYAFKVLSKYSNAIILGDFNFREWDRLENSQIKEGYIDIWKKLKPSERGLTLNMKQNWMAKSFAYRGTKSGRIDRIYIRSNTWKPGDIEIIGTGKINTTRKTRKKKNGKWIKKSKKYHIFPSDHFGVLATLKNTP